MERSRFTFCVFSRQKAEAGKPEVAMKQREIFDALLGGDYTHQTLSSALLLKGEEQEVLFSLARQCRHQYFPKENIQVRSVIETSNLCRQGCRYCSIGGKNQKYNYSLSWDVTEGIINHLYGKGRRVFLIQSGENANQKFVDAMAKAIGVSKAKHPDCKIILCMGNLDSSNYENLRQNGADAYILKFETSNAKLFSYCRPNDTLENRLSHIEMLIGLGFEVGSGNIVGLPGQTVDDLCDDLFLTHKLRLSMNSATIFSPAEGSAFEHEPAGDPDLTLNYMALMRIMNPNRLMPTTSSLRKLIDDGQYKGLMAGANTVTVHDGTPEQYQAYFPIYSTHRTRPQTTDFSDIVRRANMTTDNPL